MPKDDRGVNMEQRLNILIKDTLGKQNIECIHLYVKRRHLWYDGSQTTSGIEKGSASSLQL